MAKNTTSVTLDMKSANAAISDLGLDEHGAVQKFVTLSAKERMDDHAPSLTGAMRQAAHTQESPPAVVYPSVQARFLYHGLYMIYEPTGSTWAPAGETKIVDPQMRELHFNEAPRRGAFWDQKMIAEQGDKFFRDIQEFSDKFKSE